MSRKCINKQDRLKVFKKLNGHCAYCGCSITEKNFVVDHIKPVMSGGDNSIDNLFPACKSCNSYKHFYDVGNNEDTESWGTFRNLLSNLTKQLERISIFKIALRYGIVKLGSWDRWFYYESLFFVKGNPANPDKVIRTFTLYEKARNWVLKNKSKYDFDLLVSDGRGRKYIIK